MGTFGKAVGTAGAFIAGSRELIALLINTARHYIYSTAMPPAQALATLYSLEQLRDGRRQKKLGDNIRYFKARMQNTDFRVTESQTAIQPVLMDGPDQAIALSDALKQRGIWVPPIRYPTVPKGTDRLRVTLSSVHTHKDIDALCDALLLAREAIS